MPGQPPERASAESGGWTLNTIAVTAGGLVLMVTPLLLWIAWSPGILLALLGIFLLAGAVVWLFGQSFLEKEWGVRAGDAAPPDSTTRVEAPGATQIRSPAAPVRRAR